MLKLNYSLLLFLGITTAAKAQLDSTNQLKDDNTIKASVLRYGKYSSTLYTLNGGPITQKEVRSMLKTYPNSALELNAYKKQKETTLVGTIIMASAGIAFLVAANIQVNQQPNNNESNFNKSPVLYSLSIASIASILLF